MSSSVEHEEKEIPRPAPDGGLVAWLQVIGAWCLMFNCWGIVNTYGVFQEYYIEAIPSQTPSNIAWIGSIQAFLLMFFGALTGPLYDYGYFRALLWVGSFLMVFGMMMVSLCTKYWQILLAQGIVQGLGAGCLFIPSVAIIPTYFTKSMAFAIGIAGSGSGLGGVIYPIIFHKLLPKIGFGWTVRVLGFVMLATLIVPLAIMKVRVKPSSVRKMFEVAAWKEPPFVIFVTGGFFGFLGMYIPLYYVTTYAIDENIMSNYLAFYLLPILNAGSVFGRIIPNYFADKTGPLNMFVPTTLGLSILTFAWIGIHNSAGLIIFTFIYGVFSGTFLTLPFTTVITLSPHMGVAGVRMGMASAVVGLGLLIGTPIGGAILKSGWIALQSFGGAALLISAACFAGSRIAKAGLIYGKV